MFTLPEHLLSLPFFIAHSAHVPLSNFLYSVLPILFDLAVCPFVGHCIVCPSIYGLSSPFWYLEAFVALRMEIH
jgi:hypothetical protein